MAQPNQPLFTVEERLRMRLERLNKLTGMKLSGSHEVPDVIVRDECLLVMMAIYQIKHPESVNIPLSALDGLIKELQDKRLDFFTAVNEDSEPM